MKTTACYNQKSFIKHEYFCYKIMRLNKEKYIFNTSAGLLMKMIDKLRPSRKWFLNPFLPNASCLYLLKILENLTVF